MLQAIQNYYSNVPEYKSIARVQQESDVLIRDAKSLEKTIKDFLLNTYLENGDDQLKVNLVIPGGGYPIQIKRSGNKGKFNLLAGNKKIVANSTAMNILLQLEDVIEQVAILNNL